MELMPISFEPLTIFIKNKSKEELIKMILIAIKNINIDDALTTIVCCGLDQETKFKEEEWIFLILNYCIIWTLTNFLFYDYNYLNKEYIITMMMPHKLRLLMTETMHQFGLSQYTFDMYSSITSSKAKGKGYKYWLSMFEQFRQRYISDRILETNMKGILNQDADYLQKEKMQILGFPEHFIDLKTFKVTTKDKIASFGKRESDEIKLDNIAVGPFNMKDYMFDKYEEHMEVRNDKQTRAIFMKDENNDLCIKYINRDRLVNYDEGAVAQVDMD